MSTSKLDAVYRSILLTKFFTKGWGKPENLKRLFEFRKVVSDRDECFKLVERDYPVTITKEQNLSDCKLLEGYFMTPLERYLPGIVPEIAQKAHFQALMPLHWPDRNCKPMCLHLAGTGDHFFWRRRNLMVKPLLKEARIGGIILENPFYGLRKPTDQVRSALHNVSDIFVMGGCLILESLVLFHWCERNGLGPLGVTGLSMGGHMASLAATNWPKPLVLVPCLSWSTASAVFLEGVMSQSINWDLLEDQYLSDGVYREKLSKMVTIVDEAFLAGKKFARTYSEKLDTNNIKTNVTTPLKTEPQKENKVVQSQNNEFEITKETPLSESKNEIIDVSKVQELLVPKNVTNSQSFAHKENLDAELKQLFEENKISKALYDKLTANEKFVLEPYDIEEINKLTALQIKEVLLKCKVADIRSHGEPATEAPMPPPPKTETVITEDKSPPLRRNLEISPRSNAVINEIVLPKKQEVLYTQPTEINTAVTSIKKPERRLWSDLRLDSWVSLPFLRNNSKKIDISKINWRDRETLQFMRGIMDECTHLSNFSIPYDTSLIIAVCAKHDAYVPRDDVGTLEEIWPGAEVRYVDAGHVSAYILHQSLFRSCIIEAFERSKKRWKDGRHIE